MGTTVKISMPIRMRDEKARKELVNDIVRIIKLSRGTLNQYTPIIKVECGKYSKLVELG